MLTLKKFIEDIAKLIPIEWDRFTEKDGYYNIYGWIKRKDEQRDFVLFNLYLDNGEIKGGFCTSSAKYSKEIFKFFYGTTEGHGDCKKIEDLTV